MKYKLPPNIIPASKMLFRCIVDAAGGSSEVGSKTGFIRQAIHNFETSGYVPLVRVNEVATGLKLTPWHLSYFKLMQVFGDKSPSFYKLVKECSLLSAEDKAKILKVTGKK